jgi:UDP-N-acetylglucosamine transferase subunit ALG13
MDHHRWAPHLCLSHSAGGSILAFRKHAVLQVVPGKGDAFDFKIVDHQVERQKDGKLAKRTITEIWSWAAGEQRYMKR